MQEYNTDDIQAKAYTSNNHDKPGVFNDCDESSQYLNLKGTIDPRTLQFDEPLNRLQEGANPK